MSCTDKIIDPLYRIAKKNFTFELVDQVQYHCSIINRYISFEDHHKFVRNLLPINGSAKFHKIRKLQNILLFYINEYLKLYFICDHHLYEGYISQMVI